MRNYILFFCIYIALPILPFAQSTCDKATDMVATIKKYHYDAKPIDSSFNILFCDILLEKADTYGLFLSTENIADLKKSSQYLATDIENDSCIFYDKFSDLMQKGIIASKSYLEQLQNQPISLIENDSITIDRGKYFVEQSKLTYRWRKWLQYLTINSIDENEVTKAEIDSIYQNVLSLEQCRINSYFIDNSLDKKISEWYLTSLANTFDPHTIYFSNDTKESFYGRLSDENFTFGFELDRNERGQLIVSSIIPGGAAWNSNQINEGIILNTVIANDIVKDFNCIRYDEAMNFLNNSKVKNAKFIFQTESGALDTINLSKTKITVQENIVQSFILNDSLNKVGYIYLPSFYSSENEFGISTNGCSTDISREIMRLKKEGIQALIIDVRGNGGGHMLEAINLIGIFINYGTLGSIVSNDKNPSLIKDMNRGLIYNGPLTVMIDEFSASASEFFAVTLQDYNRALIVGATSYGKSTAQNVISIKAHSQILPLQDENDKDFVKLTTGRFYRVNGDTYQRKGVVPDVIFPSFFDGIETGEKASPSAILADHIDKETYFKTSHTLPRKEINEKFKKRNTNNPYFELVKNTSKLYSNYWKTNTYPIGLHAKNKLKNAYDIGYEQYAAFSRKATFSVNNPSYLSGYSNQLDSEKEINASVMENIKEDQEIIEAYKVTLDLINIKNNK